MAIPPRPPAPMLRSGQGHRDDAQRTSRHQDSEEQQGHPYRQTVIIINIFSLNYMMCVKDGWEERGREKDKQTKEEAYVQEDEGGRDTPDEYGSEYEGVG